MRLISWVIVDLKLYPEEEDKWFRDRRIDLDIQLNEEYYTKSGFDRGHMSRREDAEWGSPISFAEKAANMTCAYTNACPQVAELNRYNLVTKVIGGGLKQISWRRASKKNLVNKEESVFTMGLFSIPMMNSSKASRFLCDFIKLLFGEMLPIR